MANGHSHRCAIKSEGFESTLVIDLENLEKGTEGWHDYVIGVISEIQKRCSGLKGFDCHMLSRVPIGSGVSSSAALECGLAFGLNELFTLGLDKWQLIKIGQLAEHNFVGTQCGIMDQFASVMGKKEQSMLLDCKTLDFEYIPTQLDPYVILLLNTNVTHNLATSGYNKRREESETGLQLICDRFKVNRSFRHIDKTMVDQCKDELGAVRHKRCRYVLEENERVLEAANALKNNDLKKLGQLLYSSHKGQSEDYEVSCPELDFLVELSKDEPSILGARMMGGGFGGCTLNLIHKDEVAHFVAKASEAYKEQFGIALDYFQTVPSQGTHLIKENQ